MTHAATKGDPFYNNLPRSRDFAALSRGQGFTDLPDGWLIGSADIVGSTGHIAAGQYKTVNMIGAAVITALRNALEGAEFPFVFGGDGASFAVWPGAETQARGALASVRDWAEAEFRMTLRAAMVPLADITSAGLHVAVARHAASETVDYAMFTGGGLAWAETQMKSGHYTIPIGGQGAAPDLTGLSCRWSHMPARNGTIISLVVEPLPGAQPGTYADAIGAVIAIARRLERGGHPVPAAGPGAGWPPAGAALEAHARHGTGSLIAARLMALLEAGIAKVLIATGLRLGGFDARRYARVVGQNADFRKIDDGLKMTLDCDAETRQALESLLDRAAADGALRYGLAQQAEAMMTCIVPSIMDDGHIHFVDGAAGGYTAAAAMMKENLQSRT